MYSLSKGNHGLFLYSDFGSELLYTDYSRHINEYLALMERLRIKLKMKKLSLILGVRANSDTQTDFVDVYENGSLKLFIQAVPSE